MTGLRRKEVFVLGLRTPGIIDQMPSHEEGEFELVLGNKQLLSVFFLVILLLGVFFSMGYIVGRNTAPATTLSASNRTPPIIVDATGGTAMPPPDVSKPSPFENPPPKVERPIKEPPKPEPVKVEPVKVEPVKPVPVKTTPPAKVEPPKPEPVKPPQKAETPKPKPEPVKPVPTTAKGGNYLQVVATKRPDAEKVVASLSQKGFAASITPVPDSALVRVVVGPLADSAVAKTREGLNAAGYKPMLRKF